MDDIVSDCIRYIITQIRVLHTAPVLNIMSFVNVPSLFA